MPVWTNSPPPKDRANSMALHRTPPDKVITAIVTADQLIGTSTHFYRNRTTPCSKPDCPACEAGYPTRWHAWVSAWNQKHNAHFIFEMTAVIAAVFDQYRATYNTLRGAHFKAYRPSRTPNGRISIEIKPADLNGLTLPPEPDIKAVLTNIWSIPKSDIIPGGKNGTGYEVRAAIADLKRASDPTLRRQTARKLP